MLAGATAPAMRDASVPRPRQSARIFGIVAGEEAVLQECQQAVFGAAGIEAVDDVQNSHVCLEED